MANSNMIYT